MATNTHYLLICLPTWKAPHLYNEGDKPSTLLASLKDDFKKEGVRVGFIPFMNHRVIIHPMFYSDDENPRAKFWKQAHDILASRKATVLSVPVGQASRLFCPNMATIVPDRLYQQMSGGCPHLFGEVYLLVKEEDLPFKKEELQTRAQYLKEANGEDEDEEDEEDEDEDEDEKETAEERASRISKEDEEIQKKRREEEEKAGLLERQQKRLTAYQKHKEFIDAMYVGKDEKRKGKMYRQWLQGVLKEYAEKVFPTEEDEYKAIGKYGRVMFETTKMRTAFNKGEMKVIEELAREYGAFDY